MYNLIIYICVQLRRLQLTTRHKIWLSPAIVTYALTLSHMTRDHITTSREYVTWDHQMGIYTDYPKPSGVAEEVTRKYKRKTMLSDSHLLPWKLLSLKLVKQCLQLIPRRNSQKSKFSDRTLKPSSSYSRDTELHFYM